MADLDFDGYAVGGVSVGEPEEEMMRAVESVEPFLPPDRPRYAMGLGTPPQCWKWSRAGWTCSIACCRRASPEMARRSQPQARSI
jgi:tRNA-guanine transglycosylases, various specificities